MHSNFEDNNLLDRVNRIETILENANMFRKAGEPITDARWEPDAILEGKNAWLVTFRYRCKCKRVHSGEVTVAFNKKDGQTYEILGDCGETNNLVIWRKPPAQTVAQND